MPALTDASKPISSFRIEDEDGALRAQYSTADQVVKQPINRRRKADRVEPRAEQAAAQKADNIYTRGVHIPEEYLNDTNFTPRVDLSSSKIRIDDNTIEEPPAEDMPEELAPE